MPGLSGRMSTVVKAKISHLLDRAEDPAETLDYSYEKQLEQLQNVKRGIADSAAEAQVRISDAATGVGEEMADVGLAMQRALDKTENMKARADAVSELEATGTFEDLAQLGPPQGDIDRELEQLGRSSAVDKDLAKLKAELGQGTEPAPQLDSGAPAEEPQQRGTPAEETQPGGPADEKEQ